MDPDSMSVPSLEQCSLFEFVLDSVCMGLFCTVAFIGNTMAFATLWRMKSPSSATFLLQAIVVADFTVVWMLFIGDCMPALGYVLHIMSSCTVVCAHVRLVTEPLLLLSQCCLLWFTMLALLDKYIVMFRPSLASMYNSVGMARKQVAASILLAFLLTLPATFDSVVMVSSNRQVATNGSSLQPLADNFWYRLLYKDAAIFFLVYIVPILVLLFCGVNLFFLLRSVRQLRRSLATSYKAEHMEMVQVFLTLTISLVICYLPQISLRGVLWAKGDHKKPCGHLAFYLDSFSKTFMSVHAALKLVILCLFAPPFRKCLRKEFHTCHHGNRKQLPGSVSQTESVLSSMYKCADMSEMTLISNVDRI